MFRSCGDLDKQGIIDLCRKNDKEKDWSYGISDEDLDAHAEKWAETNENLKVNVQNTELNILTHT